MKKVLIDTLHLKSQYPPLVRFFFLFILYQMNPFLFVLYTEKRYMGRLVHSKKFYTKKKQERKIEKVDCSFAPIS